MQAEAVAPATLERRGNLAAFLADYKATLPLLESYAFAEPNEVEVAQIVEAAGAALAGEPDAAAALLEPLGYDLVLYSDTATGGSHLMLRERVPARRCWGLYLLNRSATARNVAVEVPHPIWDALTPEMGLDAYLRLDARYFAMAGAHRYANGKGKGSVSDMARNPRSLFQAMHRALTDAEAHVLQYHGFKADNHPGYPNVVLSNGSPQPHPELFRLRAEMEPRGETVGIFDGDNWRRLGATGNLQGRHTRSIGGRFYHLEQRYGVRARLERRSAMIDAVLAIL